MKIVASILSLSLFCALPGYAVAQTPETQKPVTEKATEKQNPPATEKAVEKQGDKSKEKGKDDCANCPDSKMQPASPATKADLSKGMKLKEATLISEILAAPEKFEGKRVLVKGPAVAVCEKRGCWVNLKSDKDTGKSVRIKVEDGEIVFPMTVMGKEVQAEGVVEKMVIKVEQLREMMKKTADAKGEKFDPASVKEDKVIWQIKGLGAKFEK